GRSGPGTVVDLMSQPTEERRARIAVAQYEPHVGDLDGNREQAVHWARAAAAGPTVNALVEVARETGIHVVCGIDERDGDCRHNSAVLLGPAGRLATYRKLHLFYDEQSWFVPGTALPVVDLPFGRVGMVIC